MALGLTTKEIKDMQLDKIKEEHGKLKKDSHIQVVSVLMGAIAWDI